jgi:hypothetical protein
MGSAAGTPLAGLQVNTPVPNAPVEVNVGPTVQLFAPEGSDVIGPGYAILKFVAVNGDVAMSDPTTRTPEPLAPGVAAIALLFVLMSPLSTSGMIVIETWAYKPGAIAKTTRMATSPANVDFKVISSPFEVVQEAKPKSHNQRARMLPAGSTLKISTALSKTGEFGEVSWGPRYISVRLPHHLLIHLIYRDPSSFPAKTLKTFRRFNKRAT